MSPTRVRRPSRVGQVLRGVLALVLVLVIVVGIPIALIAWVGWPLPRELDLSEVGEALRSTYVPEETLLKVLASVCWIIWAQLLASLLIETFAYIRGRRAGHIPFTGGLQRAAAKLIATIALIGALASSRGTAGLVEATAKPLVTPQGATATLVVDPFEKASPTSGTAGSETTAEHAAPAAVAAPAELPVYVVQRYDSLWDIAERHLGDGFRWREIWDLNNNVPQPDGHSLVSPDRIQVGWHLRLPADAVNLPAPAPPAPAPAPEPVPPPAPMPAPDADNKGGGFADVGPTSYDAPGKDTAVAEAVLPGGEVISIEAPRTQSSSSSSLGHPAAPAPASDLPDDQTEDGAKAAPPYWPPPPG